jgi:hypothetical protein
MLAVGSNSASANEEDVKPPTLAPIFLYGLELGNMRRVCTGETEMIRLVRKGYKVTKVFNEEKNAQRWYTRINPIHRHLCEPTATNRPCEKMTEVHGSVAHANGNANPNAKTPRKCSHCRSRIIHDIVGVDPRRSVCPFNKLTGAQARAVAKELATTISKDPSCDVVFEIKSLCVAHKV